MNTDELRINAKIDFGKDLFKLMNNTGFGKTMENVKKHRDIKLITNEERRNYLVSELNYQITKGFIKTTDHRLTEPPATSHLPIDPPIHRLAIINSHQKRRPDSEHVSLNVFYKGFVIIVMNKQII